MRSLFLVSLLTTLVHKSLQTCEFIEAKSKIFKIERDYRHYNDDGFWEPRWYEKKIYPTIYYTIYCKNVTFNIGEELQANYKENSNYPLHLEIDQSHIPEIPVGVLIKFTSVRTILLQGNGVKSIQPGALSGLTKLEELYLQDNAIREISRGVFNSLFNLKILDLSNNSLIHIEHNAFLGLMKLETLKLRSNRLTFVNAQLFRTQKRLKFLDLSANYVDKLPADLFYNLTNLQTVLLNRTGIADINRNVFRNATVYQLYMSSNNINIFNGSQMPKTVKKLWLKNNRISSIDWNGLESVLFLDISNNSISTISNFNGIIQYFNISNNKILFLNFSMPLELEVIDLSFNLIHSVDQITFSRLKKLHFLSLKHNRISFISPGVFKDLTSLTSLDISDNNIKELEFGIFTGLKNVKTLKIQNNRLTEVHELSFHELAKLEKVDLSNNSLSSLEFDDFIQHLTKLKQVNLDNNPFRCDMLLKVIKKFESYKIAVVKGNLFNSSNVYGMSCISNNKTTNLNTLFSDKLPPEQYGPFIKGILDYTFPNNSAFNLLEFLKSLSKHSISNSSIVNLIVRRNYENYDDVRSEKLRSKTDESNYSVICIFVIIISLFLFVIMCVLLYVSYIMFYKSDRAIYHVKNSSNSSELNQAMIAL